MFKAKLFPIDKKKFLSNLPELTLLLAEGLDLGGPPEVPTSTILWFCASVL